MASRQNVSIEAASKVAEGKIPSNAEIQQVMEKTKEFLDEKHSDLPPQTQKVLHSASELVDATEQVLMKKNADEDLQALLDKGAQAAKNVAQTGKDVSPQGKEVSQTAQKAGQAAKRVGQAALNAFKMMLTNGEFRTWFLDIAEFLHNILFRLFIKSESSSQQSSYQSAPIVSQTMTPMDTSDDKEKSVSAKLEQYTGLTADEIQRKLSLRMMDLLRRMNANPKFAQGIRDVLDAMEDMKDQAKKAGTDFRQRLTDDRDVQLALDHARNLLENFSGLSMDRLLESLSRFSKDLSEDQAVDNWFTDLRSLFEQATTYPESLNTDAFVKRVDELIDRARRLQDQYKNHQDLQIVLEEFRALFDSIKNDPDVVRFQEKAANFFQQFTFVDQSGQRHFNTDLMSELSHVVIPMLLKHLEEIPLPNIEDHNEDYEYRIENITISGYDIIPEHVYFYLNSELDFNLKQLEAEKGSTIALLKVTDIKTKIPGIKFWIKKKTFPAIEDQGVANLTIGGEGAGLNIYLKIKNLFSNKPTFTFSRVQFSMDTLSIDVVETQHSIITPILSTIWKGKIKHTIEEQAQKKVLEMAQSLESSFNDLVSKYPPTKLSSMATQKLVSAGEALVGKAQEFKETLREKDIFSSKKTDINQ